MEKAIHGMEAQGTPFSGVLYGGFMLAEEYDGMPMLMEFNVRFGDPETQAILRLLQEGGIDIYELLRSAAEGNLKQDSIPDIGKVALTVILAAKDYSKEPRTGDEIFGLDKTYDGVSIQHAGTAKRDDKIVTAGGRVLSVTAVERTADDAAFNIYSAIGDNGIHFDGMQYRTDIGHQVRTS
jgi:phosphoribosylamine--glycine ligase